MATRASSLGPVASLPMCAALLECGREAAAFPSGLFSVKGYHSRERNGSAAFRLGSFRVRALTTIAKVENIIVENDALMIIAKRADGSLRDAQSIFDQVRSFCGNEIKTVELLKAFNVVDQEIYFRVSDFLKSHDAHCAIQLVDEVIKSCYDLREFVGGLSEHLRNLLIVRSTESTQLIEVSENYESDMKRKRINSQSKTCCVTSSRRTN